MQHNSSALTSRNAKSKKRIRHHSIYVSHLNKHSYCPVFCDTCRFSISPNKVCQRRVCIGLPFCFQHVQKAYGVKIKPISEAGPGSGKGLVAMREFSRRSYICPVYGKYLTKTQLDLFYSDDDEITIPYGITLHYAKKSRRKPDIDLYKLLHRWKNTDSALLSAAQRKIVAVYAAQPNSTTGDIYVDGLCVRAIGQMANTHIDPKRNNAEIVVRTAFRKDDPYDHLEKGHIVWLVAKKKIHKGDEIYVDYGHDFNMNTSLPVKTLYRAK